MCLVSGHQSRALGSPVQVSRCGRLGSLERGALRPATGRAAAAAGGSSACRPGHPRTHLQHLLLTHDSNCPKRLYRLLMQDTSRSVLSALQLVTSTKAAKTPCAVISKIHGMPVCHHRYAWQALQIHLHWAKSSSCDNRWGGSECQRSPGEVAAEAVRPGRKVVAIALWAHPIACNTSLLLQ